MCRIFAVSPSGYYSWLVYPISATKQENQAIYEGLQASYDLNKGHPRLKSELRMEVKYMERLGFYYDMTTCVGCGACQVACKDVNHLNPGEFYRRVDTISMDTKDNRKLYHYSGACNHCAEPACVKVCPVGAMYIAEDGTVRHNDGRCIGCGACIWNCPYGAVSFSKTKGVSQKCESCYERREKGQAPACVAACITHSLKFGKLDEISKNSAVRTLPILPSPEQTDPSIRINVPDNINENFSKKQ